MSSYDYLLNKPGGRGQCAERKKDPWAVKKNSDLPTLRGIARNRGNARQQSSSRFSKSLPTRSHLDEIQGLGDGRALILSESAFPKQTAHAIDI